MTRGGSPQVMFRLGSMTRAVRDRAPDRASLAMIARRDLERYYTLLVAGQREVRELGLSEAEARAICDALWAMRLGPLDEAPPIDLSVRLEAELVDADRLQQLGARWGIDLDRLRTRLRTLTPLGAYALVDAVERFWARPSEATGPLLRGLGLVR